MKVVTTISALIASLSAFAAFNAAPVRADVTDRLYDFTDAYYAQNGINPAKLAGRKQAPSANAVIDKPFFASQRNVRVIGLGGTYTANGSVAYFAVMAGFGPDGFTNDAAGQRAHQIADTYIEYIFPQRNADPIGLANARQATVQDTDHGYFSNDPLGLWLHVWVNYTDAAFSTKDGQKALSDLAKKNGLALDGTPIIKTTSDIQNLNSKGFVTLRTRNDGLRYAVCPEIRDPRRGGISPEAFLNTAHKPDGSPLDFAFTVNFDSLKNTGEWAR